MSDEAPTIEDCIDGSVLMQGAGISLHEADDLRAELDELREVHAAALIFVRRWWAGNGQDADTCDAALALRAAFGLGEGRAA